MANRPTDGRENRSEPEIMSPDRLRGERLRGTSHIWVSIEQGGHRRVYIRQPGLFTVILLVLLFGVVMAGVLATFWRKIDVFGSAANGLRPSKDRRAAGGHF
jgi:hypothetical protein